MSIESIEKWIDTGAYEVVLKDASLGDEDSIELRDQVDMYLRTICFHITQNRPTNAHQEAQALANYLALPWE